ncbi:MAG: protein kinase, partial [Bdellovibrionales bacterium]|nr:protein kinase [Bdellovibrionales bacterium]
MKIIDGYQTKKMIGENIHTLVYRGYSEKHSQPVIIKVMREEYPSPQELNSFKKEYEILAKNNFKHIVKALALENYNNGYAIILEDINGQSLDQYIKDQPLDIKEFLQVSIQILEAVSEIHSKEIVHCDLKPHNITYNRESSQIKIIDFGLAESLSINSKINKEKIEGTL